MKLRRLLRGISYFQNVVTGTIHGDDGSWREAVSTELPGRGRDVLKEAVRVEHGIRLVSSKERREKACYRSISGTVVFSFNSIERGTRRE